MDDFSTSSESRLAHARYNATVLLTTLRSRWKNGPLTASLALLIFLLNALICRRLFTTEFVSYMFSVEGAYISLTRWVMENWRDLSWFPLWNAGEPFQATYQPGLPLIAALVAKLLHCDAALGYHIAMALIYCLGPVGVFLLAFRLSGRRDIGFLAALLFSLISPSAFLVQAIRYDLGSVWFARRYQAMVYWGEGPNVCGLSLVPFGLLGVHAVYERLTAVRFLLAAVMLGSIVLVSWPASVVLAAGVLAYLLAQDWKDVRPRIARLAGLACCAYLLIAPLDSPSTIRDNQRNSQLIGSYPYTKAHILYFALIVAALLGSRFLFRRFKLPRYLQVSSYWFFIPGVVALAAHWFKINIIPQPERFHLGMEIGLVMLAAGIAVLVVSRWRRVYYAALVVTLLAAAVQTRTYARYAKRLAAPFDVTQTLEYQVTRWMESALPGQRVFIAGSTQFWMNAWSDQPQVTGCCLPGMPNPMDWIVSWQVPSGAGAGDRDAEIALLWMRMWGAQAVVVNGPHSRDAYRAWANPAKFDGILPKVWERGDDRVYRIPSRTTSLAHIIHADEVVSRSPINGIDTDPLKAFVRAIEDPTRAEASLVWTSRHSARINADLAPGDLVSVQETWARGWHAAVSGKRREVSKDGMGLMVIHPVTSGKAAIDLYYDGGVESWVFDVLCVLGWVGLVGWVVAAERRRLIGSAVS
jgi:hypothetical protein